MSQEDFEAMTKGLLPAAVVLRFHHEHFSEMSKPSAIAKRADRLRHRSVFVLLPTRANRLLVAAFMTGLGHEYERVLPTQCAIGRAPWR